jgi:hypothetical protein
VGIVCRGWMGQGRREVGSGPRDGSDAGSHVAQDESWVIYRARMEGRKGGVGRRITIACGVLYADL